MPAEIERAPILTHIESEEDSLQPPIFQTRNENKLAEIARLMGIPVEDVMGPDRPLEVDEIQDLDPYKVAAAKAREARLKNIEVNGEVQGVIVEDTSLDLLAFDRLPGTFANQFTDKAAMRQMWCEQAAAKGDTRAVARVIFAVDDGKDVHMRVGEVSGKVPEQLRGTKGFGWDDMFIPDGQDQQEDWDGVERTFAEMTPEQKDMFSPRRVALEKLQEKPIKVGKWVYGLPEPYEIKQHAINKEVLAGEKGLQFAFELEALAGNEPNAEMENPERPVYHEVPVGRNGIKRYIPSPDSASLGIIITPWDTTRNMSGRPTRLDIDRNDNPIFWTKGPKAGEAAIAARAEEFRIHHSPEMYAHLRGLKDGSIPVEPRPMVRSEVLEHLLKITRERNIDSEDEEGVEAAVEDTMRTLGTAATKELGYSRVSTDRYMSRTTAAQKGLLLNSAGVPTSVFALGGMPPVTGWRDVLVTSAMSYMRSYIPHNSIYAENPALQLKLFEQARTSIEKFELPEDIHEIVMAQIGVSVGCRNPRQIAEDMKQLYDAGCRSFRVYTTNPDPRILETAEALRQKYPDAHLCIGPFVDLRQAKKLIGNDIRANTLLAGHGGGENCTSLEAGGAANGLELVYAMNLDPDFQQTAIGLEGGTGSSIGPLLGFVDVISMNQRAVAGGIECGGLFVQHSNKVIVQPYHGSASPVTQEIEAEANPAVARSRRDLAGRLPNVEGKPNYMKARRTVNSITDQFLAARMLAGRSLADQDALNISELRRNIRNQGHYNHRTITHEAYVTANAHRGN